MDDGGEETTEDDDPVADDDWGVDAVSVRGGGGVVGLVLNGSSFRGESAHTHTHIGLTENKRFTNNHHGMRQDMVTHRVNIQLENGNKSHGYMVLMLINRKPTLLKSKIL